MGRGGKRIGSGRKEGAVTKRTREVADQAAATGLTPLEVMLDNMRFAHSGADMVLKKIMAGELDGMTAEEGEDVRIGALRQVFGLRKAAQEAARDAAPFMHARIQPIDGKQDTKDHIPLAERVARYAKREAIEQSGGKVVELKKGKG